MTRQFWMGLIIGVLISAVVGGLIGTSMIGKRATEAPPDLEAYLAGRLKNLKIPKAPPPATPVAMTDKNLAQGGEHFNHHCAACHNLEGDADSAFAKAFYPPVADLTSESVQKYSDEQLKWIVENGIRYTGMPGWGDLIDDATQWKIVHYMRALADPEKSQKLKELLEKMGKGNAEASAGGDHHNAESEAGQHTQSANETREHHPEDDSNQEAEHSH